MKSMNDHNSCGGNNNNNANNNHLLGFSLSPAMKMDAYTAATSAPTSFYHSLSPLHSSGLCYAVGEIGAFHSPLSAMPLKSDGSLCIMEAFSRSQTRSMVPNSSPKLEDFLGGATMGDGEYGSHEREAGILSLDSIYYTQQDVEEEAARQRCLGLGFHQDPQNHHSYYSNLQIAQMPGNDELKNWASVQLFGQQAPEQQQIGTTTTALVGDGGGGNDLQPLSLSMSPGSQSSCVTAARQISPTDLECVAMDCKKRASGKLATTKQPIHRKSIDTFGQRTSQYRGVTRHRWTGRYEAHLWDNSCKKEGQTRKGRQVYLGGYDMEEKAARAYDLAALKYWGPSTHINFPLENYQKELEEMKNMTRQEHVAHLRRKSSGFSRGASIYRGVTRHHQHGRWQARIGRVAGNKDLYLGTFSTQEEAAEAYDIAAIKFRGISAVTNFDISRYDVDKILASNSPAAGELCRRNKEAAVEYNDMVGHQENNSSTTGTVSDWKMALYQAPPQQQEEQNACFESNQQKPIFSMAVQNLIGMDSSIIPSVETHFSNPSSLVSSLSNSREASPESMAFGGAKPTLETKFLIPTTNNVRRSPMDIPLSMAHLPLFAAWNDNS
ncbi:PREDICTED: AP2-like ethylene-responsive transcription factor ANT [Ipomoea nil]|uniref:AP2-like ethylene-responsive transcription factor ANT n=1 Tax=Ipomoea nil TaxID=35883 RepID=UPI0009016502|nr:PREDICTED: AP2-like ethylene-responsive transcription factor ANT [Ipomoea nil]